MSESMNQKIIKLLRLAERAGTPAEAENASRAAERLMLKLGIEEAVLRAQMTDAKPESIVTKNVIHYSKTFIKPRSAIGACVIRGMGNMRSYLRNYPDGTQGHMVIGFESDVARAEMLIPSILLQADQAVSVWWKSAPERQWMSAAEAKRAKRQFLFAFGAAVETRLKEMYREEVVESTKSNPGTELALVNKDRLVQEEFNKLTNLRPARSVKGSWAGSAEGRAAGQRANLGSKGLGGPRGAIGS